MDTNNHQIVVGDDDTNPEDCTLQMTIPPGRIDENYVQNHPALVTMWTESLPGGDRVFLRYRNDNESSWSEEEWKTVVSGVSFDEAISRLRDHWVSTFEYLAFSRQAPLKRSEQVVLMELESLICRDGDGGSQDRNGKHVVIGGAGAPVDDFYELSEDIDAYLVEMRNRKGEDTGVQLFFQLQNVDYTYVVTAPTFGEAVSGLLQQLADHRRLPNEDLEHIENGLAYELEQLLVRSE